MNGWHQLASVGFDVANCQKGFMPVLAVLSWRRVVLRLPVASAV